MKNKIKLVIFDLDGVLIDSKQNMKVSWNAARKKFNLKQKFKDYFQYVGLPFNKISTLTSFDTLNPIGE